ncbi:MAG: hypothetical protein ACRDBQ_18030 [Shewanella sp.]
MKNFILAFVLAFLAVGNASARSLEVSNLLWPGEKAVVLAKSKVLVLYRVADTEESCKALILQRNPSGEAMILTDINCEPEVTRAAIVPSTIKGYVKVAVYNNQELVGLMTVRD